MSISCAARRLRALASCSSGRAASSQAACACLQPVRWCLQFGFCLATDHVVLRSVQQRPVVGLGHSRRHRGVGAAGDARCWRVLCWRILGTCKGAAPSSCDYDHSKGAIDRSCPACADLAPTRSGCHKAISQPMCVMHTTCGLALPHSCILAISCMSRVPCELRADSAYLVTLPYTDMSYTRDRKQISHLHTSRLDQPAQSNHVSVDHASWTK